MSDKLIPTQAIPIVHTINAASMRLFGAESQIIGCKAVLHEPYYGIAQTLALVHAREWTVFPEFMDAIDSLGSGVIVLNLSMRIMPYAYAALQELDGQRILALSGWLGQADEEYNIETLNLYGEKLGDTGVFGMIENWFDDIVNNLHSEGIRNVVESVGMAMSIADRTDCEWSIDTEWDGDLNACIAGWMLEGCKTYVGC